VVEFFGPGRFNVTDFELVVNDFELVVNDFELVVVDNAHYSMAEE